MPIAYEYDGNGNLRKKIDPRLVSNTQTKIQITYEYDELNRIKSRVYNDGTPNVIYSYVQLTDGIIGPEGAKYNDTRRRPRDYAINAANVWFLGCRLTDYVIADKVLYGGTPEQAKRKAQTIFDLPSARTDGDKMRLFEGTNRFMPRNADADRRPCLGCGGPPKPKPGADKPF